MYQVKAHTLNFTLPSSWSDITLAQALKLLDGSLNDRQVICLLSGIPEQAFRELPVPTLISDLIPSLRFLQSIPDFRALPIPKSVTLPDGREISVPGELDLMTIGQKWDLDDEFRQLQDQEIPVTFLSAARHLLGILLAPAITGQPYKDVAQAETAYPVVDQLSCMEMLPLAAFFLACWNNPTSTGKISLKHLKMATRKRPGLLRRILNFTTRFLRLRH
ncbi:hypothetical protein [Larkinella arboricola]